MDKNAIKKYAVWARRELIERVSQRAMIYGITAKDAGDPNAESVNGHLLSQSEKRQRRDLILNIQTKGYEQVMEEVAYTWFNRFAALRFMEVNGYLPSHIRVFTNDAGEFKPQILAEAIHLELEGLDMNRVYELEGTNKSEELFKYLLIVQCNALNSILPGMFQQIEDYTELLLPDYMLREGSVIEQMVTTIPEEDWTDQVQIIGWLYQYYITEQNELVYDGSMSKERVPKTLLPAATTIYTPDWPVHYMVENSLGRLWLEGHPNEALKSEWKYYLDDAKQETDVQIKLATIQKEYALMKPEEIRVLDPCMGSGHILCVLFDTLVSIYEDYGYTAREAAAKIVENNLWGLDIDDRAAQLSYFAVMMKARQYDRRFFTRRIQPHVYGIRETNDLIADYALAKREFSLSQMHQKSLDYLIDAFIDAKEYGSILPLENRDFIGVRDALRLTQSQTVENGNPTFWSTVVNPVLPKLLEQAIAMTQKYHVVVTNPPYLSNSRLSPKLDKFVKSHYPDAKADLSAVMYTKALESFAAPKGFVSFITTASWISLASFERLRKWVIHNYSIVSFIDYGTELFEGKVGHNPIVSWVTRNSKLNAQLTAVRLVDFCYSRRDEKEPEFFNPKNRFTSHQENYEKIPGAPIAYWVSDDVVSTFENNTLGSILTTREGMATADNDRFLRFWYEIEFNRIFFGCKNQEEADVSGMKWFPYNKGGDYRKWYGNNERIVDWSNNGFGIKNNKDFKTGRIRSHNYNGEYAYREGITWSSISSGDISVRYASEGFLFDSKGAKGFCADCRQLVPIQVLINSNVAKIYLSIFCPTMDFKVGDIIQIPLVPQVLMIPEIKSRGEECIEITKEDWDAFETSWDFIEHPFMTSKRRAAQRGERITIEQAFKIWKSVTEDRFLRIKENEEELNRILIRIYGLDNELIPSVEEKSISIRRAELQRDVRSFVSYAVGCMFGRYSLDYPGLIYAGGEWDATMYSTYFPDKDAIIPICDDEYFEDDIVGRFVKFVEITFGNATLEKNLQFIADALGGKGSSRDVIRNYFINGFYSDHVKIYQKYPIYWLFDSGKKNGFKCLIYMHRYQSDTIARIRTDYVHELQSRYRTVIANLERRIVGVSTSERVKISKQLAKIQAQEEELRTYEEKIHHLADQMIKIDLDDGVKHNYAIFKDVLAKIK